MARIYPCQSTNLCNKAASFSCCNSNFCPEHYEIHKIEGHILLSPEELRILSVAKSTSVNPLLETELVQKQKKIAPLIQQITKIEARYTERVKRLQVKNMDIKRCLDKIIESKYLPISPDDEFISYLEDLKSSSGITLDKVSAFIKKHLRKKAFHEVDIGAFSYEFLKELDHTDKVHRLAVSPVKNLIASAGVDDIIKIWSAETFECRKELRHTDTIHSVSFSSSGDRLVSTSQDSYMNIWNVETGQAIFTQEEVAIAWSADFSPDNSHVAAAFHNGHIKVWNIHNKSLTNNNIKHQNSARCVKYTDDPRFIVSTGDDQTIRVWDLRTNNERHRFKDTGFICSISLQGKLIVSVGRDQRIIFWDYQKRVKVAQHENCGNLKSVDLTWDEKYAFTAGENDTIKVWTIDGLVKVLPKCARSVRILRNKIVTGHEDRTVKIWTVTSGDIY